MNRKKILQISHDYEQPFPQLLTQYMRLFDQDAFEVTTLFLRGQPRADILPANLGKVRFLNLAPGSLRGLKLKALIKLRDYIKNQRFEMVIAHRYKSIYLVNLLQSLGYQKDLPWVLGVAHEFELMGRSGRRVLAKLFGARLYLAGVSLPICQELIHDSPTKLQARVFQLENCIDVERLKNSHVDRLEARRHLGIANDQFVFAAVGRLVPKKNHEWLIRAFGAAKFSDDTVLVILGSGRIRDRLQSLIDELHLSKQVLLLGNIAEAPRYFKAFDHFVLPSHMEPFGMVLLEAMAANIPITAAATPAVQDILDDFGTLVEPNHLTALSQSLVEVRSWTDEHRARIVAAAEDKLNRAYSVPAFHQNFWQLPLPWSS